MRLMYCIIFATILSGCAVSVPVADKAQKPASYYGLDASKGVEDPDMDAPGNPCWVQPPRHTLWYPCTVPYQNFQDQLGQGKKLPHVH